jgi:hypothetical protein
MAGTSPAMTKKYFNVNQSRSDEVLAACSQNPSGQFVCFRLVNEISK